MIKRILNIILIVLPIILLATTSYGSDEKPGIYSIASIFHIILLICAIICLVWSLKILSLVRGGLMSKSWQMFVIGFCFLTFAQLLAIGENANLFYIPGYILTVLYLIMTLTWLVGLYQTRKILG
jgi:hypothetical protein